MFLNYYSNVIILYVYYRVLPVLVPLCVMFLLTIGAWFNCGRCSAVYV